MVDTDIECDMSDINTGGDAIDIDIGVDNVE